MTRLASLSAALLLLAGCQGGSTAVPSSGACTPTVAGGAVATFSDYAAGRQAFTRMSEDETLTAALEDASWLRLEGDPETVARAHRAYFEYGYTSFQVILQPTKFTQPSKESFLLEDSQGARVVGKPISFQSTMAKARSRYHYTFNLSFEHAITAQTRWLRLTRELDGATVQWDFGGR